MATITLAFDDFLTGDGALERAEEYIRQLEVIVERGSEGTAAATTVELLTAVARECLNQAAANEKNPPSPERYKATHRWLVGVNNDYYLSLRHGQRVELAMERGFRHAGHVEWTENSSLPALVFWLNTAYRYSLRKAKIEAKALERAGLKAEADALLLRVAQAERDGDELAEAA